MTAFQLELEGLLEQAALEPAVRARLARYGAFVLETNLRFNLTGAKLAEELASHLLESLTVVPYLQEPYVDVGSGAGLPAIPVAIVTGMPTTMIEATAKKARFLREAFELLGLRGEIVAERAEIAAHRPELRERFASGTARAVAAASTVAELLLPFISVGGAAVLQRGALSADERMVLDDASLMLGAAVEMESRLESARRILVVRKHGSTPARFPRRTGVPARRPLCT